MFRSGSMPKHGFPFNFDVCQKMSDNAEMDRGQNKLQIKRKYSISTNWAYQQLCYPPRQWVLGLFPSGKADGGMALITYPLLAPRMKTGYSLSVIWPSVFIIYCCNAHRQKLMTTLFLLRFMQTLVHRQTQLGDTRKKKNYSNVSIALCILIWMRQCIINYKDCFLLQVQQFQKPIS